MIPYKPASLPGLARFRRYFSAPLAARRHYNAYWLQPRAGNGSKPSSKTTVHPNSSFLFPFSSVLSSSRPATSDQQPLELNRSSSSSSKKVDVRAPSSRALSGSQASSERAEIETRGKVSDQGREERAQARLHQAIEVIDSRREIKSRGSEQAGALIGRTSVRCCRRRVGCASSKSRALPRPTRRKRSRARPGPCGTRPTAR